MLNLKKKKIQSEKIKFVKAVAAKQATKKIKKIVSKKRSADLLKKNIVKIKSPAKQITALGLNKSEKNPIIVPNKENKWESQQTFNPAAVLENGKVHLLYRALGDDGISRVGYAISENGIDIEERLDNPIFTYHSGLKIQTHAIMPEWHQHYNSGGSWSGCEDPRITKIDGKIYMCFVAFDGYNEPAVAITNIKLDDFLKRKWKWGGVKMISQPGIIDKSACIFPEKIKGKYVIMHRIFPNILIDYVDSLDFGNGKYLKGEYQIKIRKTKWDSRKIGAGAPPIKTKDGWLLIYYGVDNKDDSKYKIGAMLLDLENPAKVLYRTDEPILEPIEWYENGGNKFGVVYPCGAVVIKNRLFVYYGGADSFVCVATADLNSFLKELITTQNPKLNLNNAKIGNKNTTD